MNRRKVYVYKKTRDKDFNGLALDCHMHQRKGESQKELWFDATGHPHMIEGEVIKETKDGFIFRSDGYEPGEWTFKELTIEDFRRKYYRLVCEGETMAYVLKTTEDLYSWYRQEFHF